MSYTDIGFDQDLNRIEQSTQGQQDQIDSAQADNFLQQMSGSVIQGGQILSPDGRINMNLDQGNFKVNNGVQDMVQLGLLEDGTIGLLIKDSQGNILMQVTESTMLLQSPNKQMSIDLIAMQQIIKDEFNIPIVILGKLE